MQRPVTEPVSCNVRTSDRPHVTGITGVTGVFRRSQNGKLFESLPCRSGRIVVALLKDICFKDIDALGFAGDLFRGCILTFAGPEHAMLGECLGDEGRIEPSTNVGLPNFRQDQPLAIGPVTLAPTCPILKALASLPA
jgi:hypothetical protein